MKITSPGVRDAIAIIASELTCMGSTIMLHNLAYSNISTTVQHCSTWQSYNMAAEDCLTHEYRIRTIANSVLKETPNVTKCQININHSQTMECVLNSDDNIPSGQVYVQLSSSVGGLLVPPSWQSSSPSQIKSGATQWPLRHWWVPSGHDEFPAGSVTEEKRESWLYMHKTYLLTFTRWPHQWRIVQWWKYFVIFILISIFLFLKGSEDTAVSSKKVW